MEQSSSIISWLNLFMIISVAVIGYFIGFGKMEQRVDVLEAEVAALRQHTVTRTELSYFVNQLNYSLKTVDDKVSLIQRDIRDLRVDVRQRN